MWVIDEWKGWISDSGHKVDLSAFFCLLQNVTLVLLSVCYKNKLLCSNVKFINSVTVKMFVFTILKDLAYSQLWHLEAGEEEEKILLVLFYSSSHSLDTVNNKSRHKFKLHFDIGRKKKYKHTWSSQWWLWNSPACGDLLCTEIFYWGQNPLHNNTSLFLYRDPTLQP